MNSIVERLREARRTHAITAVSLALHTEAADLIEQQAERIKELEAKCDHWRDHYKDLRQRIDDAPVVAHITEDGKVFDNGFVRDTDKPLISKEDLQR